MKETLVLVGGGGHCKACIDVIEREGRFRIAGVVEQPEKRGQSLLGYPVIGCDDDLPGLVATGHHFLVTLGQIKSPAARIRLFEQLRALGASLPAIVSPLAYLSPHASLGPGSILMHRATVNAAATIGANCILNSVALIEHDAQIGDHCHISTGAIVNGGTQVAEGTFIGSNAVTREGLVIGPGCLVGAGVTVTRNLPAGTIYTGTK